jgi:nucleotide-binding universal stress UspA family protein
MPRLSRLLVPVDFSSCSLEALEYAGFLAEKFDATMDVLHVLWEPPPYVGMEVLAFTSTQAEGQRTLAEHTRRIAEDELKTFLSRVKGDWKGRVTPRLLPGNPWQVITQVAAKEGHELIVMGTHGRSGFSHALLGSVAEKVVRKAPCPVLTIRARGAEEAVR